jgi:hypothetical protein
VPGAMVYRVTPEFLALPKPGSQTAEVKRKKAGQLGPQDFGQGSEISQGVGHGANRRVCVLRGAQWLSHTPPYKVVRTTLSFRGGTKLPPRLALHTRSANGLAH